MRKCYNIRVKIYAYYAKEVTAVERDISESLSGRIENIVYSNPDNDYTVLEISDPDGNLVTAVGIIPMAAEGEDVILTGIWTFHKDFGRQFAFDRFEKTLPAEEEGILQYLSSRTVKGVGPVTALRIVQRFGAESFDVIENHPEWLADIPGISMKKAAEISVSFKEQNGIRGVMMLCRDALTTGEISAVYKALGASAVGLIRDNPYVLCRGDVGISFPQADKLGAAVGIERDSELRIIAGMNYTLDYNAAQNGHTCLPRDKFVAAAAAILGLDEPTVSAATDRALADGELSRHRSGDTEYVMRLRTAEAEDLIADRLKSLLHEAERFSARDVSTLIEKVESELSISFAKRQREALFASLEHGVMILTGGPGTGKTTVIRALLSIYRSLGMKTVLAAPTGRAAKRMSEATGEEAKTVHRMLEMERSLTDGHYKFNRDVKNPLDERVVIIDEASMLDLQLTEALMCALRRGSRLLLIGDSDQLPSVGAGNVLADLIASDRIPTVRLDEIFRQSGESLIITNAHRINRGEAPVLNVTDNDFFFVRREREGDIADTVASLITERLPRAYGKNIRDRIQVITPSRRGAGGVDVLNARLQATLNPKKPLKREHQRGEVIFREGDKVMQVVNNYELEWDKNGVGGVGLFNGDIGVIERINAAERVMTINFEDRLTEYPFENLDELELAYAITVHKSQGSEYPVVIIPMYSCPPMLMTRNLLYTAVTRARRMVILVGRSDVPWRMVENNREVLRYTALGEKISEYI